MGQAAEHLPALAILTHTPVRCTHCLWCGACRADAYLQLIRCVCAWIQTDGGLEGVPTVAMVGKGIMYDTGGLSIKTKTGVRAVRVQRAHAPCVFCS